MKRTIGIIQARVGSTRLPNKVIKKLGDKTILEILLNRLAKSKTMNKIVVATTTKEEDSIIERIVLNNGFEIFRGSEEDVLDRYYKTAKNYNANVIVRITSDNPLTDISLIDYQVDYLIKNNYDYVSPKDILLGLESEVFTFEALENAWRNSNEKYQREHVTPYIYENTEIFNVKYVESPKIIKRDDTRLTIDTQEDFELYQKIYEYFKDLIDIDIKDIIKFLDINPDIKKINQKVRQKHYTEAQQ